ncbi:MAG: T9SS type A sorting domain-containing protein [Flavobacteriales bacterium]|nr:T9SS type A sorting domain-containing protein [Flavobacteriales bacterium]
MKQLYSLSLAIFTALGAHAQITIGQAEMPHANDELVRVKAVTNPFINYTATGPAHTWDFANLAANAGDTTNYQTVASTNFIYAIVYADIFFNGNRANHAKQGTDIAFSNLLPITNPYTFRYRSSSVYKTVGYGVELAGIGVPIIFDEHDVIYELPLDFGDASASHSAYHIEIPNVGYYGFEQDRTNEVDGWGAITTPGGVFDVLRVKTTLTMRDSIFGFAIARPVVHEYKWLTQGLRVPVLQVNTTTIFGQEVVTAIYYYDVPRSIDVVAPLASTLCPGATLPVFYESTGAFNAGGFFVPANHFTAQLSDATGSFAAPITIGDVTATTSGSITVTIPANTPPGTGYRIRVISTSPDFIGASDPFDISIGGTPTASITAAGPSLICTNDTLVLTAVGGPGYQWQLDGADIAGAMDATYAATLAGDYTVLVDNTCGTATSNTITVAVNAPPTYTVDQQNYLICAGDSVDITAHDQNGQSPLTYQWYLNNAPIVDATDSMVTATLAGLYTLVVTNGTTGCTFTTEDVLLDVLSVTAPNVSTTEPTTFCEGLATGLIADLIDDVTYQWMLDGVAIAGAESTQLAVTAAGQYTVVITTLQNCSATSDAIDVVVNPLPPAPLIGWSNDSLLTSGTGTFQWYVDGNAIDTATDPWWVPTENGTYTVQFTDTSGCSSTSDGWIYLVTGINGLASENVQVLPNPSSGTFAIQWPVASGQPFEIVDATGKQVLTSKLVGTRTTVDMSGAEQGMYFLRLLQNGTTPVLRIVITR